MRIFNLTKVSPVDGVGDFVHQWRQPTPYRWRILGLSVALTFTMIVLLMPKTERAPPAKPDVIWINTFAPNRSEKEIIATNIANQKRKEAQEALDAQKEEARKNFYRNLARATGFDPDQLAREFGGTTAQTAAKPIPAPAPASANPSGTPTK